MDEDRQQAVDAIRELSEGSTLRVALESLLVYTEGLVASVSGVDKETFLLELRMGIGTEETEGD